MDKERKGRKEENKQEINERKKNGEREEEKGRKEKGSFPDVLTVREEKSIHASRAMREYQNL